MTGRNLVEAPGTAPGSEWFIAQSVYRHSRAANRRHIQYRDELPELNLNTAGNPADPSTRGAGERICR